METRIALFQKKEIRKTLHAGKWWFVIVDVVAALTDSTNPAEYLKKMRLRDPALGAALKGGDNLSPPLPDSSKGRGQLAPLLTLKFLCRCWNTKADLLAHRGDFSPDSVYPQSQGQPDRELALQGNLYACA